MQTYSDWEALFINEFGSDDGSREIILNYAKKDKRIKLIQNDSKLGLAQSLNKGFQIAKGNYIARFDADDIAYPARLERQVEFMEQNPNIQPSIPVGTPDKMVLRTDNLVKKYGKRTVANHVSINVTQGEIVGLLGPNGAGKTTTFYMTVGLITPNEGQIYLNDLNITKYPVYKRAQNGIGYLAQEPSVFRKLTVENNIKAVLQMTNTSAEYQRDKLESLIAEFSLEKVRHNLGDQLSGGERRRTEIARCLAIDPKFIMLDEPFAGVDPIAVEDIQSVVYHLKEKNIGILITDHNAQETLRITDRAYLLFEGKILFQGTSEELAENPVVREKYLGRDFMFYRKKFDAE